MSDEVDLLTTVLRRWPRVIGGLVLGLLVAFGLSLSRTPVAEAQAELFVGPVDVPAEAVSAFVVATDALAETYAQLASSTEVVSNAAEAASVPADEFAEATEAEPVPESPLIRVKANDADPQRAEAMAQALATQLEQYIETNRSEEADVQQLQEELASVSRKLARAQLSRERDQRAFDDAASQLESDETASELRSNLTDAAGRIALLELEQQTLHDRIVAEKRNAGSQIQLRLVSTARVTGSDGPVMQRNYLAAGALIGLTLGTGLALTAEVRAARRRRLQKLRDARQRVGTPRHEQPRTSRPDEQPDMMATRPAEQVEPTQVIDLDRW